MSDRNGRVSWDFEKHLEQWGPDVGFEPPSPDAAHTYCRSVASDHYENFTVVSWLLPRRLRPHFQAVYAYCRWADDLADEVAGADRSLELLAWWRSELTACYEGNRRHPVFVALGETIDRFRIPAEPFADLLSAFEQDQRVHEYETFTELLEYCRRSANPVGRLVLYLCEAASEKTFRWSDQICTGLQLANFWQDVARDHGIGRVYLPREDRVRFGYSDDDLHQNVTNPSFLELMRFEVTRTRDFLEGGSPLFQELPGRLQIEIELFQLGGLRILERIEEINFRVWDRRPEVTKWDALKLGGRAIGHTARRYMCGPPRGCSETNRRRDLHE